MIEQIWPEIFYYKTNDPQTIIKSGFIKISEIYGTVSLTVNATLNPHCSNMGGTLEDAFVAYKEMLYKYKS